MLNKFFILLFLLILPHCGYSPVYKNLEKSNLQLIITKKNGDKIINNIIEREIKRNTDSNGENIYYIKFDTNYEKNVISKDAKGLASNYQIKLKVTFKITNSNSSKEIIFEEKQNMEKISDYFDEQNYENNIKHNFGVSVVNRLKLELQDFE